MKILMLNYEWPPLGGGGGPVADNLAIMYVALGHSVDVVTMRFRDQPKEEVRGGVRLHRVWCLRKKIETCETPEMLTYVVSGLAPATRLCRALQPEVIHCRFAVPTGLLAWMVHRITRIPYVVTVHGSDLPGHNPARFVLAHRFTGPVLRGVFNHCARIISP
jgi:glycosyltransferase involved in cell wall biosynthesis